MGREREIVCVCVRACVMMMMMMCECVCVCVTNVIFLIHALKLRMTVLGNLEVVQATNASELLPLFLSLSL